MGARTHVIDAGERARVPFLRGILTRSLCKSGLEFPDAYSIASKVRDEIRDLEQISSSDLRERVAVHLEPFGAEAAQRYQLASKTTAVIMVRGPERHASPFSRGGHRLDLELAGLSSEDAARLAADIHDRMIAQGATEIELRDLQYLTYECLQEMFGKPAATNYVVWQAFTRSNRPLVVLIGGTTGTGKSTVSGQIAHLLGIARTQPTDMLREVMRMMIPQRLMPVLHASSYNAWQVLPARDDEDQDLDALLAAGYLAQTELLSVACEAVIQRALQERLSLILEGVHVHPLLLRRLLENTDAVVVPVMLAVLKPTQLKRRFRSRSATAPTRRHRRYLEHFDAIWKLQSFLLSESDHAGVQIVANEDKVGNVRDVVQAILATLSEQFDTDPGKVFV